MGYLRLLLGTSLLLGLVFGPVTVQAADRLAPRVEVSVKGGSERSMLTTEFWAPLAQKNDRVVYADVRLMGDNDENREGNLGFGYRQLSEKYKSVLGVHGWIDRRRTENNNTFHQITLGVESLGDKIDLRANGYIALEGGKTAITPATGPLGPYLAGSSIFYNTNGSITETPQHGFDAEAGYRLPLFEHHVDALRVYGGGYHFFRSGTDNVTGIRIRTEAQINKLVSVGARFQHDGPRGSQGFLEATLRFPFSAKKLYQTDKLRSRLDESPERDIDIVTAAQVDTGLRQITNPTSGEAQRILYVDNTNAQTGDGTKENPFNNLTAAQNALQANDILYIFHGDGTTHNMDQGITISQNNVQLIGSGSALTIGGYTFLNAGAAPTITNTQPTIDNYTGNGITVVADNADISGITVTGAVNNGIIAIAENGLIMNSVHIHDITSSNNGRGVFAAILANSSIKNISFNNIVTNNNTNSNGISINTVDSASIDNIAISNITGSGNATRTVTVSATNSVINNVSISNVTASANSLGGIYLVSQNNAMIANASIFNANTNNNNGSGVFVQLTTGGKMGNVAMSNITTNNNGNGANDGIRVTVGNGSSASSLNRLDISNVTSTGNKYGVYLITSAGTLNETYLSNINSFNNTDNGVWASASNGGVFGLLNMDNIVATGNATNGILVEGNGSSVAFGQVTISNSILSNNIPSAGSGLYIYNHNGATMGSVTLNNLVANANLTDGVRILSTDAGSSISTVTMNNIKAGGNNRYGVSAAATSGGILNTVNLNTITTNNNIQYGVFVNSGSGGSITSASLSNITANGNLDGVRVSSSGSTFGNATLSNITANNNSEYGIYAFANSSGSFGTFTLSNATANNNTQHGVYVLSNNSSTFGNAVLNHVTANSNSQQGVYLNTGNSGVINAANLAYVSTNNNAQNGIYIQQSVSGSGLNNIEVSYSDGVNNGVNGIYLLNSNPAGLYSVDLGGGALSSTGQNRFFGNTGKDIRVNYAAGGNVFAQHNWWGVNTGLNQGTRATLSASTTLDSSAYLTTDPRP